ncbi:Na+/H+ antiporter subunit E [Afifella pfennigii]|uniref:Na+/H+ antiporter subunit E n=1 Tax=Afifella pfennigii TaxID=209897 RepID=UPI00047AADF0|nr:Na+/H+ antiporter subunit E [Afifella pfennigii]
MYLFPVNILLAIAWAAVTGSFSLVNLLFGFVLGACVLWIIREQIGTRSYLGRSLRVVSLGFLFFYELVMSAIRVAWLVVQPKMPLRPAIIAYPLRVNRDFEITLLANLITLTPGTLSIDVSPDRRILYIHAVDVPDPDELKREIAEGFERKILEAFR